MQADYIYPKFQKMVSLNESMYKNLAQILILAIGNSEYFNGSVEMDCSDFHSVLKVSLLIYHEDPLTGFVSCQGSDLPQGRVVDIIPVWWELSTTTSTGVVGNDFSWRDFKAYLF